MDLLPAQGREVKDGDYGEFSSEDAKFTIERVGGEGIRIAVPQYMANVDRVDTGILNSARHAEGAGPSISCSLS